MTPKSTEVLEQFELQRKLLAALSDDLSLPLLQIKSSLESMDREALSPTAIQARTHALSHNAGIGLQLIDAYRLALQTDQASALKLEPVAVGSLLNEVAHQLSPYASSYATRLEVDVTGRFAPVLANKKILTAAMQCLGASIIRAQAAQSRHKKYKVVLGAHRSEDNMIAAGVFSNTEGLTDQALRAARKLIGKARQPIAALPSGSASGVLIADMLCSSLWQPLKHASHNHMSGLATAIPVSQQLHLV